MNFNITLPERIVLESLQKKSKSQIELISCTKLDRLILNNVLNSLISKNLIKTEFKNYTLNKSISKDLIKELNDKQNLTVELNQIIQSVIYNTLENNQQDFKLKKVFLNTRDRKVLDGMLYNLNSFLNELSTNNSKTADQTVIFWGENKYENIINYNL